MMGIPQSKQARLPRPEGADPVYSVRWPSAATGGLRVAVKDVIDVAGYPTRGGSAALANAPIAQCDAPIIETLRASGCTLTGKTNLHELAYGVTGLNAWMGTPVNPRFPDLIPGGSSSGSAVAVARGDCDFAIGTDTGGSIRTPANCCGLFGLKTTFGRISREGFTPAVSSLDVAGPLAASAAMLARAMTCLEPGFEPRDIDRPLRAAWFTTACHPGILDAVKSAAATFFDDLTDAELPGFDEAFDAGLTIIARETYAAFASLLETGRVGTDVADRLARAAEISDRDIADANGVRDRFTRTVDDVLDRYAVVALPVMDDFPPALSEADDLMRLVGMTRLQRPFNLSGHPAIAIPLQPIGGRPIGLQLVAQKGNEELLIAIALKMEEQIPALLASSGRTEQVRT